MSRFDHMRGLFSFVRSARQRHCAKSIFRVSCRSASFVRKFLCRATGTTLSPLANVEALTKVSCFDHVRGQFSFRTLSTSEALYEKFLPRFLKVHQRHSEVSTVAAV